MAERRSFRAKLVPVDAPEIFETTKINGNAIKKLGYRCLGVHVDGIAQEGHCMEGRARNADQITSNTIVNHTLLGAATQDTIDIVYANS